MMRLRFSGPSPRSRDPQNTVETEEAGHADIRHESLAARRHDEIGLRQRVSVDAIGHAQHARRKEALAVDARAEPTGGRDPFTLHLDARDLDWAEAGN